MIQKLILILFVSFFLSIFPTLGMARQYELNVTSLQKESGTVGFRVRNPVTIFWTAVNDDGSAFVDLEGNLLKIENQDIEIIKLPRESLYADRSPVFYQKNLLLYWDTLDESHHTLFIYDWIQEQIVRTVPIITYPFATEFLKSSHDGSTILYKTNGSPKWIAYSRFGDEYKKSEVDSLGFVSNMIAKNGKRIFSIIYSSIADGENPPIRESKFVYIDKLQDGWSEKKEVPGVIDISDFQITNPELQMAPIALANEGKTLVLQINLNQLALIHEENGKWSEPEYVGEFTYVPDIAALPLKCSDDGRVIALEQAKTFGPDGLISTFDLLVFMKDNKGQWSKNQVNPPDVGVLRGIVLNGDGSKLFWVPERALSVQHSKEFK